MRKSHIAAVFIFLLCTLASIHAEAKTYKDEEKGYNVTVEIALIGENMSTEAIKNYNQTLFDWCNELGKNTKIIKKFSNEVVWGIKKGLSEYNFKKGESYFVRVFASSEHNLDLYPLVVAFITINDKKSYKVETIIETYVDLTPDDNTTVEEAGDNFSNAALGYKGSAKMDYIGVNLSDEQMTNIANSYYDFANKDNFSGQKIGKLTKEQEWLLNEALNKYNLKQNEVYAGYIGVEPKTFPAPFTIILVIVTITDVKANGDFYYNYIAFESTAMDD